MTHNIPLMRAVYAGITREPFSQSSWVSCVAGHAIRVDGRYGLLRQPGPADGVQVYDPWSGAIRWTEEVAAELLGLIRDEADWAFKVATDGQARDWLEDLIVSHDMRELALVAAGFDTTAYPLAEVRG